MRNHDGVTKGLLQYRTSEAARSGGEWQEEGGCAKRDGAAEWGQKGLWKVTDELQGQAESTVQIRHRNWGRKGYTKQSNKPGDSPAVCQGG